MAAGSKHEQPTAKHSRFLSPALLILTGAVLVIARLLVPYRAGLIFKGSVEEVNSICRGGAGSFAVAMHPSLQSCNKAAAWMAGLNIVAVAGYALAAFGVYLAWRARQPGAGEQQ
jgi:hypothetical protein